MPLILFLIFIFVWYFPVYRGQGTVGKMPGKYIWISILIGMIPTFLLSVIIEGVIAYGRSLLDLPDIPAMLISSFIEASLVEEGVKFWAAYLIIRRIQPGRRVDYVLIFGAVGLGFEVTETLLGLDSITAGVLRGVLALHIIWQFWMGLFYWEYRQAKERGEADAAKKALLTALGVPFLIHGFNDFLAFAAENSYNKLPMETVEDIASIEESSPELRAFLIWVAVLFLFIIAEVVYQIITFRMAKAAAKASLLDEEMQSGTDAEAPAPEG